MKCCVISSNCCNFTDGALFSGINCSKDSGLISGRPKSFFYHEVEVEKNDLAAIESFQQMTIIKASRGDADYLSCCEMLFKYYKAAHESINPLTSPFEEFIELMPDEVLYTKANDIIQHAAFVESDEVAYVCSIDEKTFECFAFTIVNVLFEVYTSVIFEADNTDWAATTLKNLFNVDSVVTFDTWIYESVGN